LRRPLFRKEGFTLIEVIVSVAILSICLVMVIRLFSGGLRASRTSCDYTRAVVHAKDKMEELSDDPVQDSGEFDDGFRWESEMSPYLTLEDATHNLWNIKVKITWTNAINREKSIELVSLRILSSDDDT
jgi:prepilin-type N-terminal cleavage/methylation domain-containing protein